MGHEGHEHDGHEHHGHGHDEHEHHDHDHQDLTTPRQSRGHAVHGHHGAHPEHGHGDGTSPASPGRGQHLVEDARLERGCGAGKILFLDAPSGLAGDMIVAALVDLGVPREVVANALASLPMSGFHVGFGTRVRSGIVGTSFEVSVDRPQPTRTYSTIVDMIDESDLDDRVKSFAHRTFRRLAVAEAKVHRTALEKVHFHEVGAVDSIVDVIASSAALDHLDAELTVSPLPMGRGFVKAAHGTLPLPAPATVECLAGFATFDAGIDVELVTPTGAAIVGAHATGSHRWPAMAPERIGWGAGSMDLADRPNVLRAVLGTASKAALPGEATHAIVEVNVDDATGELAASWIESLLAAGALDAWATPITMKKGRPALTLSALCRTEQAAAVEYAVLRETTSLGVRRYGVTRAERPRRVVEVSTPYGRIPVKVAEGPFGPPQVKPEFDACARAARSHGVPVREVLASAMRAWAQSEPSPAGDQR